MSNSSLRLTILLGGLMVTHVGLVACGKSDAPSDVTGAGGSSGSGGKAVSGTGGAKSAGGASSGGSGTGAKVGAGGGGNATDASTPGTGGADDGGTRGTGGAGAGGAGGAPDCFTNPKTHFEIINACTSAEKVDKTPKVPLLLPDGGLPALP